MDALIIIDMQDCFLNRAMGNEDYPGEFQKVWDFITDNIIAQIAIAKFKHSPIVVLELNPDIQGTTVLRIRDAIGDYDRRHYVSKTQNNGSDAISNALWNDDEIHRFIITGVNKSACVSATAAGLSEVYPYAGIVLVEDAMTNEWGDAKWGWDEGNCDEPNNLEFTCSGLLEEECGIAR